MMLVLVVVVVVVVVRGVGHASTVCATRAVRHLARPAVAQMVDRRTGPRAAASSIAPEPAGARGSVVMPGSTRRGFRFVAVVLIVAACGSSGATGGPTSPAVAGRALNGVPLTPCVI